MKDKLLSFVVLPSIIFALFLAFSPVGGVEATGGDEQVTICHPMRVLKDSLKRQ